MPLHNRRRFRFQVSSINRVLRNIAATKEQTSHTHHLSSAAASAADSVYDKLRMFNGQAAAASWAWYGAAAAGAAAGNPAAAAAAAATSPHLAGLTAAAGGGGSVDNVGAPPPGSGGGGHGGLGSHHFAPDGQDSDEKKPLSGESICKCNPPFLGKFLPKDLGAGLL